MKLTSDMKEKILAPSEVMQHTRQMQRKHIHELGLKQCTNKQVEEQIYTDPYPNDAFENVQTAHSTVNP